MLFFSGEDLDHCQKCGACCKLVLVKADRLEPAWALVRGIKIIDGYACIPSVCKCLSDFETYDKQHMFKCDIYANRPVSCKIFKIGSKECSICQEYFTEEK